MSSKIFVSFLAVAATGFAQQCPVTLDGRVPAGSTPATFATDASPFDSASTAAEKILHLDQIIKIPSVTPSLFDTNTIPFEVTLSDGSIFAPSATNVQTGFRRCEMILDGNTGTDDSTLGQKTMHFSLMKDTARPLNQSHEYQLFFLEDSSFSTNQVVLKTGTIAGVTGTDNLVMFGNVNTDVGTLFSTAFTEGVMHNFGVVMDFDANTTEILYSQDAAALTSVKAATANDISGQGQWHFGALKKPTGEGIKDVTKEGFQPSGINEGVIFAGIFEENSAGGCVSLSAAGAAGQVTVASNGTGAATNVTGAAAATATDKAKGNGGKAGGAKNVTKIAITCSG
ncbi:hypothetical protein LSUE1_G003533 [Lachnellula suecica]|uniref:Glycoside hydrolase 131 catalytic N-terminal domain-containing protein n=1 Tax=Lachnellula suecica TaxID=602035 RepID=A0A8T9C4S0_9HELO|nr:hypothetical protein LSUE1_G003533 [Lachnellula suecica]